MAIQTSEDSRPLALSAWRWQSKFLSLHLVTRTVAVMEKDSVVGSPVPRVSEGVHQ